MRLFIPVILLLAFVVSCGSKGEKVRTDKEGQLARAESAFEELDREAGKEAKDLTLDEGAPPPKKEKPKDKYYKDLAKRGETKSKYPIVDGLPVWVKNPNYGGVLGGVGIAKKIRGKGYAEQKRLAKQIALADLAKQIEVVVKAELTKREVNIDSDTYQYYKKKFSSLSEQEVRAMLIKNAVIEDEWVDPKTGELYIWVVIKR